MTTQLEQAWELAKQRFADVGVMSTRRCASSIVCRFPCTAGKAMMSQALKIPAPR